MYRSATRFVTPIVALAITVGALSAVAQTKKSSSKSKTASEAKDSESSKYHRLPTYYGKLELDDDQVEEIYAIKDEYGPQIEELQQELNKLKGEMNAEIDDVLTSSQRTALAKLKGGSSSTKAKTVSSSASEDSGSTKSTRSRSSRSKGKSSSSK